MLHTMVNPGCGIYLKCHESILIDIYNIKGTVDEISRCSNVMSIYNGTLKSVANDSTELADIFVWCFFNIS